MFEPWQRLLDRIAECRASGVTEMVDGEAHIPIDEYTDSARWSSERDEVFRRLPFLAAHSSELPEPNSALTRTLAGIPVVLHRDGERNVRAFVNVCRHRGAAVCDAPAARPCKAFVCGYHGWTYDTQGHLIHIPQAEAFPETAPKRPGLVALPAAEACGLIWVNLDREGSLDMEAHLGELAADLEMLGLGSHTVYRREDSTRHANWKLILDLFLEAYHVRVLHKDSVYSFFLDNIAVIDRVGPHFRIGVGRRPIDELSNNSKIEPRELMSIVYFLFPGTFILLHPDYISLMSVQPLSVETSAWSHIMLVPDDTDVTKWDASWELISQTVFDTEDLGTAELMQRGLATGVNNHLTFGRFEHPAVWFHGELNRRITR